MPLLSGKTRGSKKERKERQAKVDELDKVLEARREKMLVLEDANMRKENQVGVNTAAAKRARALLWAHLLRLDLEDKELEAGMSLLCITPVLSILMFPTEQLSILKTLPGLLKALLNISLAHNWLSTSTLVVQLQASLVQALPPSASPLAQILDVDPEEAFELSTKNRAEGRLWAEKAAKKDIVNGTAKDALRYWPRLEITDASFKGELKFTVK